MNFPLYIAKRYIFSKSKNNAINIISRIALLGIIVGALALFVVLSVFSGLREFSLQFTNNFDPDLKVQPLSGKSFFITPQQEQDLKKIEGLADYSKIVEERVLFYFNEKEQVTYIKGVDSHFTKINTISQNLYTGQWLKPNTYQAVAGYGIANKLSLGLMDFQNPLIVYVPKPGRGAIESEENAFNKEQLMPVGIYAVNDELDSKYVFVNLDLAQSVMQFRPNQITGLEIKTKPNADQTAVISQIEKIFTDKVEVRTRAQLNATLYKMLNTENLVLYLIFTLVFIMILFAFAGAIFMIIIDKKENLKTLLSLGTEIKSLRKIFLYYGISLCIMGGSIGITLGIVVVFLQKQFQLIMITNTLAYPVVFTIQNVILVITTIVSLGYIATRIASSRVSKQLLE
ncbi:ABC transporter permease [Flavobacterium sp. SUN046]|uniref:ABC transporter permease n=1 Tax=Flavobacterium sp. SUN046 TaxID=3002440 RepID=UPI002DBB340D|nr:ABC transporter permease [Flavobacterium sp. SUN046]MEC4047982.1 ABC transporter permease [Flavobacterium sp. SUN046]